MPDSGTRANTQERIYYTTASSITLSGVAGFDGPVKYVVGANHTTGDGILCTVVVSAGRTLWVSDPIALNLGPNSIEMYAAPESGDPVRDRDVITVWRLLPDATNTIPFTEYVHDEFVRQIDTDLFAWATPQQPDPDLSFWFENEMGDVAGFATSLPLYWDRGDGWHQKLYDPWDRRFCVYGKVFRQGPISAWEYELGGSALPDSMTLLRESAFGDEDSRFIDGILLDSGAVVVAWNHGFELPVQDFAALVGVSYLPPDRSEWQTIYPIQVPGAGCDIVSMRGALAQHPVDGSVWLFAVRDASGRISAIHFTETDSGLVLDWVERDFLAKPDGFLAPDGERCCIRAVADSWRGVIQVVYVTNAAQYVIDGTGTTRVGPVALTQVAADGQTTGTLSPLFTPRLLSGAMLAREEGVYLAGVAYPSGTLDLHLWDGEDWSVATTLGPAQLDGPVIDWTSTVPYPDALARAIVARMADGQVHTYVIGGDDG